MTRSLDGNRRMEENAWTRNPVQAGMYVESDEEEEPALYRTDEFRIRVMKVLKCSKKYCHDWTRCPFAHPGEKATRRDPMLGMYTGIACPDMKKDQRCPRGQYCPYAHNVFEYWLHPTRYRTALCRDVERCTRKICFFAHAIHEIRTNVDRPYVSPEQLVAANDLAAADPRVQAEYKAAAEETRRSNKPGLMTGLFNTLDDDAEGQSELSLSLRGAGTREENQEVMQALSALMRGDMGPISNPYAAASNAMASSRQSSGTFRSLTGSGAGGLESTLHGSVPGMLPLDQRIRRIASDPTSRQNPRTAPAGYRHQEEELLRGSSQGVNTIDETAPAMFPDHLNTMVQTSSHQSRASQQNLANAAAHLLMEPSVKEPSIWSTPVSPLDQLNSTASTCSDRQSLMEGQTPGALEAAYRQKLKKRLLERHAQEAAAVSAIHSAYGAPGMYGIHSGPRDALLHSMPAAYGNWNLNPNLEFAMAIQQQQQQQQQQQAMQNQAYLVSMYHQQQQQQQAYEQEIRNKLQQAIHTELRNHSGFSRANGLNGSRAQAVETGFDLRFGGLGENQGLFSHSPPEFSAAAHPNLLNTTAAHFVAAPAGNYSERSDLTKQTPSADTDLSSRASPSPCGGDYSGQSTLRSPAPPPQRSAGTDLLEAGLVGLTLTGMEHQPPATTTINA